MNRSISEPSIGTGASSGKASRCSANYQSKVKKKHEVLRGEQFWEGRFGKFTKVIVKAPWNTWYQSVVLVTVIYQYVLHFLIAYYLDEKWHYLDITIAFMDMIYFADVFVHMLHSYWPLLRRHMRVYRRNVILFVIDIISLIPFLLVLKHRPGYEIYVLIGRWLSICRIYRIFIYFQRLNESLRTSRRILYIVEHIMIVAMILHACTCIWYYLNNSSNSLEKWFNLGYPPHVNTRKLQFKRYVSCWYYCSCRFFNVIFGDAFPLVSPYFQNVWSVVLESSGKDIVFAGVLKFAEACIERNQEITFNGRLQKWLTSLLMLLGYVIARYLFVGILAWEFVLENIRMSTFFDRVHHMISFLKFLGAPASLIDQAVKYKLQLWRMKDGIVKSNQLNKLPRALQMELIFDINVSHFHDSLLFRETEEAFMRQICLMMRHELFLSGQHVWSQGVVKSGMICIKRGVVEMLSDEDDESPMIAFKQGTILGELSLFYSIPSKVTVRAATYVEVQVLRRTDFMRAMSEHPLMLEKVRRHMADRLQKAIVRQDAIRAYDNDDSRLLRTRYRPMKVLKEQLSGVEDEDPTFVDNSHLYYRDENNTLQPKFTIDHLELYRITNNVTTIEAPRICLRSTFPWILEPDTDFTHMCDVTHFAIVLYMCIMCPYSAINNSDSDGEKVVSTVVLAGLVLNIYVQLTTAIVDKKSRKETVKEIAEVKMSSFGFYLDIISVFPVSIFSDTLDPHTETVAGQIAKVFPVLQMWHLWAYLKKWANNFDSHVKLLGLVEYFMIIFLFSYWSGCLLYLVACPRKLCRENSWMDLLIYWETKVFFTVDAKHEKPLMSAFAFGSSVFIGTGMSDVSPGVTDLVLVVFLLILGSYLSCVYISKICSIYLLSTQRKLKFKESMRELFYFLTVNRVNEKIKSRVRKFFGVQWYYNNAVSTTEIFEDMSANIQQEVLCLEMVDTLLKCPLFQECNRDFLQTVASNTRTIVLPDDEIVQHTADIGREMYILQRGHCNLLNHLGKVVASVGPGSIFGVIEMLFGLPKVYTVVTSTNCILVHVEYSALVQCWGTFPDISHPIMTALADSQLLNMTRQYEEAKPQTGKIDVKINRITQELKESFVVLTGHEKELYVKTFDKLGVMKYVKYIFMPGCITPHGMFLKCWCAVRFLLAIFYIITVPYDIATKRYKHGGGYTWVDIVLYIDIVLMSYVAYYNEKSLLITHPLLTVTRYLRRAFILDILSIFPFEHLVCIVNDTIDLDIYRMNRILLVTRIIGAFSYWENDIMHANPVVVLLKFLPLAVTFINFSTAIIFMFCCEPFLPPNSYFIMVNCTSTFIVTNDETDMKYAAIEYANTFYWVNEIFVGLGCTPVSTSHRVDQWLIMTLKILGTLYFAFMFGYVASTRSAAAHALLEHTERTTDLANFLYQENVDPMLTSKTLKYFEYVWKRTNGSNPQIICRRLNSALMEDTLVFMYERALREVPLFGKVERSFIRVITQHLNEMYFLKGDTVVQYRDVQQNIYIIYRGKVDVLSSFNEMITCMGPGGMFGNFSGQALSSSDVSIFASRGLDLLVIPATVFFNLIKYYPKIQEPLNKAFEVSRDYILPITMDLNDDSESEDSEMDVHSLESAVDSKSASSRIEIAGQTSLSSRSQSNLSQAKSSTSVATIANHSQFTNLFRPGTMLFQVFGYTTCLMATMNYVTVLYELVTLNDCFALFWMQALFDIFFYVKTFFTMYQGYVSSHGDLILDAYRCRRRYFKHKCWFWTDFLANFPLEMFGLCFRNPPRAMHYLRANKLLRLKYLTEFYRKTSAELTNNLTILQTVMTVIIVVLLIHTFTCAWLLALIATRPTSVIRTLKMYLIDEDTPQWRWDYTTSFYIVVSALTATGGDEYVIDDVAPLVILGIVLTCGKMLAAIVIATAIQMAYSSKYALNQYERVTNELIDILRNQGLSTYQLQKFWKYVQQLWITERGRQLPVLLSHTPYVRRCDLMSSMFGQHLRNCYLFSDTGEPFLRQLTVVMDYTKFFPGNYIVVAGDSEARMYWVASGTVSVVSVRPDLTETTHELLGPGDVFGILQGINRGIMHCFSYRAETKVSVLILSLDSWINILPFFPEAKRLIAERSEILFAQI